MTAQREVRHATATNQRTFEKKSHLIISHLNRYSEDGEGCNLEILLGTLLGQPLRVMATSSSDRCYGVNVHNLW